MTDVNQLITQHLDIWSSAIEKKSSAGRGNSGGIDLYGIKRLRELILELAVRGKLVPQINGEGHADGLLDKILLQQAGLYKKGQIKKPKTVAKISDTEKPFGLPQGWTWCRISQVGHDWGQKVPSDKFTYIDVGAINKELGVVSEPTVLEASEAPSRARKLVRNGTVVYSTVRPYLLNIAVISEDFDPEPIASTAFAIVHPFEGVSASFLYRYFRSPTFISYVEGCQTGIAYPAINDKQFFSAVIPLPPTEEQRRIVAKVDELMALCDALEAQAEDGLNAHQTLVETCLATLINSQSPEELTQNWTRIEANFDTLFTTEESTDALSKTILELGAMGRLHVPLEAKVTANVILDQIAKAKGELVALGKIRREKPLEKINSLTVPFTLPANWIWAKIGDVALFTQYGTSQKASKLMEGIPVLAMGNIQGGAVSLDSEKLLPRGWEEFPTLLLQPGDLLYNRTNSAELVGKTGFYDGPEDAYTFASYLIRIRVDQELVRPKYLNFIMNSPYFRETQIVPKIKKQTGQANVNGTFLKNMLVPLPPTEEQDAVIERIEELNKTCQILRATFGQINALERAMANTFTSKIH